MSEKQSSEKYIRRFNTSGTCNPVSDFYISRALQINKALESIKGFPGKKGGQYFTLFASRQMGKTTFVEELVGKLDKEEYCPLVISFETVGKMTEEEFLWRLSDEIRTKISIYCKDEYIQSLIMRIGDFKKFLDFEQFVKNVTTQFDKKFVLIIDEFDGITKSHMGDLLHTFREIYFHRGEIYNLHSLILIGVRNITDVNMDQASPFNTNDELPLPPFTKAQAFDLMHQYEEETGQNFAQEVKEQVFYNTQGQPGLTNALCKMLVEDYNPGGQKEIGMDEFNEMFSFFIHGHISKNVVNIINKAKQYKEQIIEIFDTQKKMEFNIDTDWIGYLYVNGAIDREVIKSEGKIYTYIKFANPIYQKKIYNCFKPDFGGESARYFEPDEPLQKYYQDEKKEALNLFEIVQNYQRYVNRRGSQAFRHARERADGTKVEAAYHYSLDAYLNSAVYSLGGATFVEFPTGNGKTDIFVQYKNQRSVIEIKNYQNPAQVEQGKQQLARYAKTEGLCEAYLVIFTEVHPRDRLDVHAEEKIDGITIRSVLVNVNFRLG